MLIKSEIYANGRDIMLCGKCECLVNDYYISYKYKDVDYCPHCMRDLMNTMNLNLLVVSGAIEEVSYNEEFKKLKASLEEN